MYLMIASSQLLATFKTVGHQPPRPFCRRAWRIQQIHRGNRTLGHCVKILKYGISRGEKSLGNNRDPKTSLRTWRRQCGKCGWEIRHSRPNQSRSGGRVFIFKTGHARHGGCESGGLRPTPQTTRKSMAQKDLYLVVPLLQNSESFLQRVDLHGR